MVNGSRRLRYATLSNKKIKMEGGFHSLWGTVFMCLILSLSFPPNPTATAAQWATELLRFMESPAGQLHSACTMKCSGIKQREQDVARGPGHAWKLGHPTGRNTHFQMARGKRFAWNPSAETVASQPKNGSIHGLGTTPIKPELNPLPP